MNNTKNWLQEVAKEAVTINRPKNLYEHSMGKCERIASDALEHLKEQPSDEPAVKLIQAVLKEAIKLSIHYHGRGAHVEEHNYEQVYDKFKLGIEMMCALYGVK
jgi:hypothetical protein